MEPREDDEVPWLPPQHLPDDARRLGLSPLVPDGALLEFAGSLDGSRLSHRIVAWVLLVAFVAPVLLMLLRIIG